MMRELTVKELAERERVTKRTVYNWVEQKRVTTVRTPGGAIRILDPRAQSVKSAEER